MRCAAPRTLLLLGVMVGITPCAASQPHRITVVDASTRRGIPLVELTTTNSVTFVTDSAGVVAFEEPGLMDRRVHLRVRSHGYRFPEDAFGFAGVTVHTLPGGETTIEMERVNIAERLYRITGQGIYRDSVLLGDTPPIAEPLLNGQVMGQDSAQAVVYEGKIHWFWGDTSRPSYPLGIFEVSGATSELPSGGGLDPGLGIDLTYFVDEGGLSRPMCPIEGPGPVWISGLMVTEDEAGEARLFAHFARVRTLGELLEQGIVEHSDQEQCFEPVVSLDLDERLHPHGHAVRFEEGGEEWFLFCNPFPTVRVGARPEAILDTSSYEGFTCLAPGQRLRDGDPAVERDEDGDLVWDWKPDTDPIGPAEQRDLITAGLISTEEIWWDVRDAETGDRIAIHAGSIQPNDFRGRWVMIGEQIFGGPSLLGEIWYSEADSPLGPWEPARRIVTHDRYSFYNPVHHPFFDQEGGRLIYFEGTHSTFLVEGICPTPRYDYNQIMYRLDLGDPRLDLN
ncbi:hypothetical protein JXA47_11285 [Candidatus Sumerlaeota bacterium]|nr:hypothetical protein [Candidatus Sumerlaeota bacterium]